MAENMFRLQNDELPPWCFNYHTTTVACNFIFPKPVADFSRNAPTQTVYSYNTKKYLQWSFVAYDLQNNHVLTIITRSVFIKGKYRMKKQFFVMNSLTHYVIAIIHIWKLLSKNNRDVVVQPWEVFKNLGAIFRSDEALLWLIFSAGAIASCWLKILRVITADHTTRNCFVKSGFCSNSHGGNLVCVILNW